MDTQYTKPNEQLVDQLLSLFGYGTLLEVFPESGDLVGLMLSRGVESFGYGVLPTDSVTKTNFERFYQGPADALPFEDQQFKTIVCLGGLDYFSKSDLSRIATQLYRVTEKNLFITVGISGKGVDPGKGRSRSSWESLFFDAGFRIHSLAPSLLPLGSEASEDKGITIILEKVSCGSSTFYSKVSTGQKRDMLRVPTQKGGPYLARYELAKRFVRTRDRVLELDCGTGFGCELLYRNSDAICVTGIDADLANIEYATETYEEKDCVKFEATKLSDSGALEMGCCELMVVFESHRQRQSLRDLFRSSNFALTPGGRFVVSISDFDAHNEDDSLKSILYCDTDFSDFVGLIEETFILEQVFARTTDSKNWIELLPDGRCFDEIECVEDLVFVGMKDPLCGYEGEYRGNFEREEDLSEDINVLSFARDYKNPWLLRSMVTIGHRLTNKTALCSLAERVLVKYPKESADYGAALCVLAYQTQDADSCVIEGVSLLDRIDAYLKVKEGPSHVLRWQISLTFYLGSRSLKLGNVLAAEHFFERCVSSQWWEFSPHLATKACSAAFELGMIRIRAGRETDAKDAWSKGIDICIRALRSPEGSILVDPVKPVPFGFAELELVVDAAVRCSRALYHVEEYKRRPSLSAKDVWSAISALEKNFQRANEEIEALRLENGSNSFCSRDDYDRLVQDLEESRTKLELFDRRILEYSDEIGKFRAQLDTECKARGENLVSLKEAENQRDSLQREVDQLVESVRKTGELLSVEHATRLENLTTLKEAEEQRNASLRKIEILVQEVRKVENLLDIEHEARRQNLAELIETESQRDEAIREVAKLADLVKERDQSLERQHALLNDAEITASKLRDQIDLEHKLGQSRKLEVEALVSQIEGLKENAKSLELSIQALQKDRQCRDVHIHKLENTLSNRDSHIIALEKDRADRDAHVARLAEQLQLECDARTNERGVASQIQSRLEERIVKETQHSNELQASLDISHANSLKDSLRLSKTEYKILTLKEELRKKRSYVYGVGSVLMRWARKLYCFARRKRFVCEEDEQETKIVQINTHDLIGGAERSSYDLHTTYRKEEGIQTDLIVAGKHGDDDDVHRIQYREADWEPAKTWRDKWGLTEILYPTPIEGCFKWPHLRNADVVHVHNMHGQYWNSLTLAIFAFQRPTVLTLHDEYTLTGDCCFTYECNRWLKSCGKCPMIGKDQDARYSLGGGDLTRLNVLIKRALFRTPRAYPMAIVTPSEWLANRARRSKNLAHLPIVRIHNGIDLDFWKPCDQTEARKELGLSRHGRIGLVVAHKLHDPRKGFDIALNAIESLPKSSDLQFVVVGKLDEKMSERLSGLPVTPMGYVDSKEKMRTLFAAADFTVAMSRIDNLPYMCIESLACGRPVLGSAIGGIPEIVVNKRVGWLVEYPMPVDRLLEQLRSIETEDQLFFEERFEACRQIAESRFSLEMMKTRYLRLYQEMIESSREGRTFDIGRISDIEDQAN